MRDLEYLMTICLSEAENAYRKNEVPVGALVVDNAGKILAQTHNNKERDHNPCGHAELLALQQAGQAKKDWRLTDCTLVVSLEPCPMCLACALYARVQKIVFGAYDPKGGAVSMGYYFHRDPKFHHKLDIVGGIRHYEAGRILSQFFKEKRKGFKKWSW